MKKILFVILAVLLILSIFTTGCPGTGYRRYLATIHDIDIWADNSSPVQYFVDVVSGEPTSCDSLESYNVTRASNTTIRVEVFNKHLIGHGPCDDVYSYAEHTIPLGSDFVHGVNYTVEVNDVIETFIA